MNVSGIAGTRLLALDCDEDTQEVILRLCRESCIEVVFMSFPEFLFGEPSQVEVILLSFSRPTNRVFEMIPAIKAFRPGVEVILLSRSADEDSWCRALTFGACDLLSVPPERSEFLEAVAKAGRSRKHMTTSPYPAAGLIHSPEE